MFGLKKQDFFFIINVFIFWRITLLLTQLIIASHLPLQDNFLGGGIGNYLKNPYLWSFVNFDGEHFLSIAHNGYRDLQYFFFPLYPLVVGLIAKLFGGTMHVNALVGLIVSHVFLLIALIGLFKLVLLKEVNENRIVARQLILLLLLFPTSFYLVSMYSESLFLALCVWSFYFAKKKKWFYAFLLAGLSTATRVVGLALVAGILAEYILMNNIHKKLTIEKITKSAMLSLLGLSGLLIYMYYVWARTGDPLHFFNNIGIYGQQRSAGFVLLPQVFYRYVFKILPNINYEFLPVIFTPYLELLTAIIFGLLLGMSTLANLGYKKLKKWRISWGYLVFSIAAYIIPTFSGSFSSLPRYVLIIFPAFMLLSKLTFKYSKLRSILIFTIMSILLMISFSLFVRGYWVS